MRAAPLQSPLPAVALCIAEGLATPILSRLGGRLGRNWVACPALEEEIACRPRGLRTTSPACRLGPRAGAGEGSACSREGERLRESFCWCRGRPTSCGGNERLAAPPPRAAATAATAAVPGGAPAARKAAARGELALAAKELALPRGWREASAWPPSVDRIIASTTAAAARRR